MRDSDLPPPLLWFLIAGLIVFFGFSCVYCVSTGRKIVRTRFMVNDNTGEPIEGAAAVRWGWTMIAIGVVAGLLIGVVVFVAIYQYVLGRSF